MGGFADYALQVLGVDDDTALELYEIQLDEATRKIIELRKTECQQ